MTYSGRLKLKTSEPVVDHISRSYAILMRDALLRRVQAMRYFQGFNFTSNKSVSIQPHSIPFCGVYLLEEILTPDGDINAGEIRFRSIARIGFSVIVQNNDATAAEYALDLAYQAITVGLFTDPTVYLGKDKDYRIQGFTHGQRQHVFGAVGLDNELPVAELRYELVVDLGTFTYEPYVPDTLDTIDVTVKAIEPAATDPLIEARYDVSEGYVGPPVYSWGTYTPERFPETSVLSLSSDPPIATVS